MLHIQNLVYRVGERALFDGATAHIPAGHRVGLVGSNGSGKTTLLRLIDRQILPSSGSVRVRQKSRLGLIAQEAPTGQLSPLEAVLAADKRCTELIRRVETEQDPAVLAELHDQLLDIDAHTAPSRAAAILAGLGFEEQAQHRPIDSFSGGWRMRIALAAVLFVEPDLLLLDEPTNHLDLESALWLESYLKSYPHTILMVSHDRHLLNNVVERILHLHRGTLQMYRGGFDDFERARHERQALAEAQQAKQEARRREMQRFVDRFRAKATKAKQAQSRIKALARMSPISQTVNERRISFRFPEPPRCSSPLIKLDRLAVGYEPDRPVLEEVHLSVYNEDRIALLGANGNGKTTMARLLAGQLLPSAGEITCTKKLKVSYFAQDQLERLDVRLTAFEQMRQAMPDETPSAVRAWLGRFGFEQQKAEVSVAGLSGGEKTRLVLALLTYERPNLMILDEPTNHLDVDAREALIMGLCEYKGALVLISHDRHLIETTVDQLWLVRDGTAEMYHGDLDEYRTLLLDERLARRAKPRDKADKKQTRKEERRQAAQSRARIAPLTKAAALAEQQLADLMARREVLDAELADPAIYSGPSEPIAELNRQKVELTSKIAVAEEEWLEAQSALEEALGDGEDKFG